MRSTYPSTHNFRRFRVAGIWFSRVQITYDGDWDYGTYLIGIIGGIEPSLLDLHCSPGSVSFLAWILPGAGAGELEIDDLGFVGRFVCLEVVEEFWGVVLSVQISGADARRSLRLTV